MAEINVQIRKEERGEEKKVRVSPYLDEQLHHHLRKLAFACNTTKAELALKIIELTLTTPNLINYIQDKIYKVPKEDRVIPISDMDGNCSF